MLLFLLLIVPHKSTAALLELSKFVNSIKNSRLLNDASFFRKNAKRFQDIFELGKDAVIKEYTPPPSLSNVALYSDATPPPPPPTPNSKAAPPPPPPTKIKGLKEVKQYFADFGYMNDSSNSLAHDYLDDETKLAIKTYQDFFNLNVTYELEKMSNTFHQMSLPRCAVPDLNVTYELNSQTNTTVSWPQGIRWFPNGTRTKHLTYGFPPQNEVPPNVTKVFKDAFGRWSKALTELNLPQLNFSETDYDTSDIKIGFYNFGKLGIEEVVIGGTIVGYENGSYGSPIVADILLDGTLLWVLPGSNFTWSWKYGEFDLETVAMHQIGHILGLDHSTNEESVMYPSIKKFNETKVELTDDDKESIRRVYGISSTRPTSNNVSNNVSGCGGRFTVFAFGYWSLTVTTLSLGFVLLFFY
ncbi:hypothetical protein RIF29_36207 [Crotalaria pallida]|uniref:Peptidase metallopeptidase domain-containing protein n=1 Tax=Crotalaria pallida TaxID=3830 RepID=A0AAN9EAU8_CROPI